MKVLGIETSCDETAAAASVSNTSPDDAITAPKLRQNNSLQQDVRSRIADLGILGDVASSSDSEAEATSKSHCTKHKSTKSGRSRTDDDVITKEIDWPHYHVYRGADRQPAKYEDLSIAELTFGYLSSVLHVRENTDTQGKMLNHLHELMRDAMDYP